MPVSILVTPWNHFNNPVIVGYFLPVSGPGALLGPFFGILVADYYLVRKQKFSIRHMYLPSPESIYYYNKGVSRYALYSLILSAIVSLSIALRLSVLRDQGLPAGSSVLAGGHNLLSHSQQPRGRLADRRKVGGADRLCCAARVEAAAVHSAQGVPGRALLPFDEVQLEAAHLVGRRCVGRAFEPAGRTAGSYRCG